MNIGGDIADDASHGEPVVDVEDGTPGIEQVDARNQCGGIADDGHSTITAPAHCSASPRSREACNDAATDTLAALRAWVAALDVEQDEVTVDTCGGTHAPGGYSHCCIEVEGGGADDEVERRAVDGIASPHAGPKSAEGSDVKRRVPGVNSYCCVKKEGGGTDDAAKRRAVDGIASP